MKKDTYIFPYPISKTPDIQRRIEVEFIDKQYTYSKTFYIPDFFKDFHVDFLPEGGELLNTTNQIVAFKALGSNGLSKEINGVILNQNGDTISIFESEHKGMGAVSISPQAGDKFHAIVTSSDGITKRFELRNKNRRHKIGSCLLQRLYPLSSTKKRKYGFTRYVVFIGTHSW